MFSLITPFSPALVSLYTPPSSDHFSHTLTTTQQQEEEIKPEKKKNGYPFSLS